MNKRLSLIMIIFVTFFIVGCTNQNTKQAQINSINTNQNKTDKTTSETASYTKWNGKWSMGDNNGVGAYGLINIGSANEKQFKFSFDASYTTKVNGDLNPNVGHIEGIAYFSSVNEAYYTNIDYPDYKMTFKMLSNNTITVKETNIKTGDQYGLTPFGGHNVGFSGNYTLNNDQVTGANTKVKYDDNLCTDDEDVLYSFKTANSSKIVSICISKTQPDYIVYRFGTKDNIELEYPSDKNDSWSKFEYMYYSPEVGSLKTDQSQNALVFMNNEYTYIVYQDFRGNTPTVGIRIGNKTKKETTEIKGLPESVTGSLSKLRDNKEIKISKSQ